MSAPAPVVTAPAQGRLTPLRLLAAIAFTALGTVAVWQGFGAAGYGTDAHALRVVAVAAPLFVVGLVIAWPRMGLPVRAVAVLLGLGGAAVAWWLVPCHEGGWSLREAVDERDKLKSWLASPLLDNVQNGARADRALDGLKKQYPSLIGNLRDDYRRWADTADRTLAERYRQTPLDDLKAVQELLALKNVLNDRLDRATDTPADVASRQWLSDATSAKTRELNNLKLGDWTAFDRTAPGRQSLAEALPEARDTLLRAEREWVDSAVELIVSNNLTPKPGEDPPKRTFWFERQKEVLALKSLDASDGRFALARRRLFTVAHREAQREAAAHLEAGRYEVAYGIARTHAVEWNTTAGILGADEQKSLDALRDNCAYLAALAAKAASPAEPPDVAPPPRTKDK